MFLSRDTSSFCAAAAADAQELNEGDEASKGPATAGLALGQATKAVGQQRRTTQTIAAGGGAGGTGAAALRRRSTADGVVITRRNARRSTVTDVQV